MKMLYFECRMGAAGDMLCAALAELLTKEQQDAFLAAMNGLGLPGVTVALKTAEKQGVRGTHYQVTVGGAEEGESELPDCSRLSDIRALIAGLPLPAEVLADAGKIYNAIAAAEAAVHGEPVDLVHFHEVGALDAVADIVGCCLLFHLLAPERVVCSPVNVGSGFVRCAHGLLPVPAPATARLLEDVPAYAGAEVGELCTPTGAALLAHFAADFSALPTGRICGVGYGMGKKDFAALNCVRAFLLEDCEAAGETVIQLECNLDDMTPEALAFACEQLLAAGALDVWTENILMKKGRAAHKLCCLCRPRDVQTLTDAIFRHTTTLGVRRQELRRETLSRGGYTAGTCYGDVRVKTAEGHGVYRAKPEYEDLAQLARENGVSLAEVADEALE